MRRFKTGSAAALLAALGLFILTGTGRPDEKKGTTVSLDGLSSRAPADWKEAEATRQFRFKEFKLPKAAGDKADAELIIFYFGEGGGGGVEENIRRWKGMFEPPEGKKIDDVAKVEKFDVGNVKVTYLDISGTYLFKLFPMAQRAEPRPDHRMLSVIFASPKGPYFIRVVGPEKTVAHHKKGFDEWLKNFK